MSCVERWMGLLLSALAHKPELVSLFPLQSSSVVAFVDVVVAVAPAEGFAVFATRSPEYLTPFNSRLTTNCCSPFSFVPTHRGDQYNQEISFVARTREQVETLTVAGDSELHTRQ